MPRVDRQTDRQTNLNFVYYYFQRACMSSWARETCYTIHWTTVDFRTRISRYRVKDIGVKAVDTYTAELFRADCRWSTRVPVKFTQLHAVTS